MIPAIMANDRQPVISYFCLLVIVAVQCIYLSSLLTTWIFKVESIQPLSVVMGPH